MIQHHLSHTSLPHTHIAPCASARVLYPPANVRAPGQVHVPPCAASSSSYSSPTQGVTQTFAAQEGERHGWPNRSASSTPVAAVGQQGRARRSRRSRSSRGDAAKGQRRIALPRPHPQPRIWAAAAAAKPPGTLPWDQPTPPALVLLQSLQDFRQPRRVHTEGKPLRSQGRDQKPSPPASDPITVKDVIGAARSSSSSSRQRAARAQGPPASGRGGSNTEVQQMGEGVPNSAAAATEPLSLEDAVQKAHILVLNNAVAALGAAHLVPTLDALVKLVLASGKANSYTWASAFGAYDSAGRPDMAVSLFQLACRRGIDIGPMGASALIKLCASQNNVELGLELFHKMTSLRTTFNRYVYNCLMHLCGAHGRVYDSLDLLAAMRTDGATLEDCTPDGYTYSALLRAITVSRKWELLPMVYKQMVRDKVDPSPEVWAQLVSLAGRANRLDLATAYFSASRAGGSPPSSHIYNALLATMARVGADVKQMMSLYQDMVSQGLPPDAYTYVPLFSALAKAGSSLEDVDALALEMREMGVQPNTQLGTALLNAYKHVPTLGLPDITEALVSRVDALLPQLVAHGHANMQTFALVAAVHAQAGRLASVQHVLMEAARARAPPDARALRSISLAYEDGGLASAASYFMDQAQQMRQVQMARQQQERQRQGGQW